MLGIWSELSLLRSAQICSESVFLIRICSEKFGPISAIWGQKNSERILIRSERIRSVPIRFRSEYPPHSKDLLQYICDFYHCYHYRLYNFMTLTTRPMFRDIHSFLNINRSCPNTPQLHAHLSTSSQYRLTGQCYCCSAGVDGSNGGKHDFIIIID